MRSFLLASIACVACTTTTVESVAPAASSADSGVDAPAPVDAGPDLDLAPDLIAARPYESKAPSGDDGTTARPLVLALHGRGQTGPTFAKDVGLLDLVDAKKVLVAYPTAKTILGATSWAAMQGFKDAPDDVAYLRAVIADMKQRYAVDTHRVVIVGLSLGGFMANYLACSAADKITGFLSISGSFASEEMSRCNPSRPLSVTLFHGTADTTIDYQGGTLPIINKDYPSASSLYGFWSKKVGCASETALAASDFDTSIAGSETTGKTQAGCEAGRTVTFYTSKGGEHVPELSPSKLGELFEQIAKPRD